MQVDASRNHIPSVFARRNFRDTHITYQMSLCQHIAPMYYMFFHLFRSSSVVIRSIELLTDELIAKSIFLQDADGSVPFYWGVDPDSRLVVSDDDEIVNKACGKSSAPFPKGNE